MPALAVAQEPTWSDVHTFLSQKCVVCHSGDNAPLGLKLSTFEDAIKGSVRGAVLKPGDVEGSELLRRVRGQSEPRTPLVGAPLSQQEIQLLERWVKAGLPSGTATSTQSPSPPPKPEPDDEVTFAHIGPLLLQRCAKCHKDAGIMGSPPEGLRLDSYANVTIGGERLVIVPEKPGLSELVRRIERKALPRMPFDGPPWLAEDDIRLLRQWVQQGARDAGGKPMSIPLGREVRLRGEMTGPQSIDEADFLPAAGIRTDKSPSVGDQIEVRGTVNADGELEARRLRKR